MSTAKSRGSGASEAHPRVEEIAAAKDHGFPDLLGAKLHLWILAACIAAQPFSTAAGNIGFGIAVGTSIARAPFLVDDWRDCIKQPWMLCLLAWAAWSFTTLLWSPDPAFGARQYATLRLLLWVPILWPHRVNWRILGAAAVASACALVVVQGAQVLFGVLRSSRLSPGAGWVHPTQSGVWQAVALVGLVGASSWGAWRRLVFSLPATASLAVGIVFTGSRAAALSAMAGLAAMTAVPLAAPAGRRSVAVRRVTTMIAASAAIAVGASFASPYLGNKFRQSADEVRRTIDDQARDASASIPEYRIAMWKMGIEAWPSHPIAGWGIGSIPTIARDTEITHPTQDMRRVRMIHSTYLHALVEGGLVGAGLLLASMALGAKAAWAAVRNDVARAGPACAAVAWLVAAGFDGYHQSGGLLSIGMIVIPLACGPLPERTGE